MSYTRLTNGPHASLAARSLHLWPTRLTDVRSPRQWPTRLTNGPLASLRSSVLASPMPILLTNGPLVSLPVGMLLTIH